MKYMSASNRRQCTENYSQTMHETVFMADHQSSMLKCN